MSADFTDSEFKTLQFAPFWVFTAVASADGNIDKKETAEFFRHVQEAPLFNSRHLQQVLLSVVNDADNVMKAYFADERDLLDGLEEVASLVNKKMSADEANLFKGGLLLIGRNIGAASGKFLGMGDPISEEERLSLALIMRALDFNLESA